MPHPHAEATYRVITSGDAAFASIPGTYPAKVSPFATKAAAEAWITEHQSRVQSESKPRPGFRSRPSGVAGGSAGPQLRKAGARRASLREASFSRVGRSDFRRQNARETPGR